MTRRKRYSAEFKREALRRANEVGVTEVLVAEELGINARQLRRWRDAEKKQGKDSLRSMCIPASGASSDSSGLDSCVQQICSKSPKNGRSLGFRC